jgi:hypothetical protein
MHDAFWNAGHMCEVRIPQCCTCSRVSFTHFPCQHPCSAKLSMGKPCYITHMEDPCVLEASNDRQLGITTEAREPQGKSKILQVMQACQGNSQQGVSTAGPAGNAGLHRQPPQQGQATAGGCRTAYKKQRACTRESYTWLSTAREPQR